MKKLNSNKIYARSNQLVLQDHRGPVTDWCYLKTQQLCLFYNHTSHQITCLVFYNLLVLKSYKVNDQIFNCHGNQASITN